MSPIRADEVDRFVREEGEQVTHMIGLRCYCRDEAGQLDPNCQEHDLAGNVYREERTLVGLITGVMQHRELLELGIAFPGDCVFSPESETDVATGDKIVFTWPLPYGEGDSLVRGFGDSEPLTYRAFSAIYCGDEDRVKYVEGQDFRFDGKEIQWEWDGKPENGSAPAAGKRYMVKYRAYLEWIVFDIPQERISGGDDIGAKVVLRKLHMAGRVA